MPIDEVKFGELIGTVGALVMAVAETKGSITSLEKAILPVLKEQQLQTAAYRDESRNRQEKHEAEDRVVHEALADTLDWMRGDGTPENPGAKKQLNAMVQGKTRFIAVVSGIGIGVAVISHSDKIITLIDKFL